MFKRCSALVIFVVLSRAQPVESGCALSHAIELHQSGDLTGAMREYQACLAVDPEKVEVRSNLGAVYARLGRYQDAIDQYQKALQSAPAAIAPRLRFNLALAYYKSFQIPEAARELESLHSAQPQELNVALLLADCRLRMGEFRKAVDLLMPLEPSGADNEALDYVLGMALIRDNRVEEGQRRVDRILRKGESAEGHFLIGSAMFMSRNYPGAVGEFAKAVALNPKVASLQSFYGQALLATGDPEGAAAAFGKELVENPNDYEANFQLASILAFRGKQNEAKPLLERAVQVRPASAEARAALEHGFRFDAPRAEGGVARGAAAPAIRGVELQHPQRPVVLVFGSYTCPKLRTAAAELNRLAAAYKGRIDFRLVYIREAHAEGGEEAEWQSTINQREGVLMPPARTDGEMQEHANVCVRKLHIAYPTVIDGMSAAAEKAYDAWPSRVYLVDRAGKVAYSSRLGEQDFQPAALDTAIRETLAK